jgi:hypothetical protein
MLVRDRSPYNLGQATFVSSGLKPAPSTVPATTAKQQNDKKDDDYRGDIHERLPTTAYQKKPRSSAGALL